MTEADPISEPEDDGYETVASDDDEEAAQTRAEVRLSESTMRALLRLANELHTMPRNLVLRQERMLRGLAEVVGADAAACATLGTEDPANDRSAPRPERSSQPDGSELLALVYVGIDDPDGLERVSRFVRDIRPSEMDPSAHPGGVGPELRRLARRLDLDHCVCSVKRVGRSACQSVVQLFRKVEREDFSPLERRVVELFHDEATWLFRRGLPRQIRPDAIADPASEELSQLTERQRDVLRLLLAGLSEKEIARQLDRSRHTVHMHVKGIYRALGVNSRAELLARFVETT